MEYTTAFRNQENLVECHWATVLPKMLKVTIFPDLLGGKVV